MARILVVDDNRDTADTFAILLGMWGHEAKTAYTAESVLHRAADFQPDAILLDIGLPITDGHEVARQLRQCKQLSGIKLVAVSGHVSQFDWQQCKESGFDRGFSKPVNPNELQAYLDCLN